jgi:hypothetical protein
LYTSPHNKITSSTTASRHVLFVGNCFFFSVHLFLEARAL